LSKFIDSKSFGIAVLIFAWSAAVGLVYNSLYSKGIPLVRKKVGAGDTLIVRRVVDHPDTQAVSTALSLEEAHKLYVSGEALFLDARPESDYEKGRIDGALSLPESEFDDAYSLVSPMLEPGTRIVVYCQGVDCDESMIVAERLTEMGYKRVDVFLGGITEWLKAGYPTSKDQETEGEE
jgi:rhodanese-related sulfurtransferase